MDFQIDYNFTKLWWDFCQSRISAGFGKSLGFRPEPEPKSGTALNYKYNAISDLQFFVPAQQMHDS